jgi:hypothetical protein
MSNDLTRDAIPDRAETRDSPDRPAVDSSLHRQLLKVEAEHAARRPFLAARIVARRRMTRLFDDLPP